MVGSSNIRRVGAIHHVLADTVTHYKSLFAMTSITEEPHGLSLFFFRGCCYLCKRRRETSVGKGNYTVAGSFPVFINASRHGRVRLSSEQVLTRSLWESPRISSVRGDENRPPASFTQNCGNRRFPQTWLRSRSNVFPTGERVNPHRSLPHGPKTYAIPLSRSFAPLDSRE